MYLWHGRALIVGPGIDSSPHAHFALQLTLGLDRPFRARLAPDQPWQETGAAVFAPNQAHQIDCGGAMLAHLFVEMPLRQQTIGTVMPAQYQALPDFAAVRSALEAARRSTINVEDAAQAAGQWLACAVPQALMPAAYDERIAAALAWIAANPGSEPDGALLARKVHLSESRFTHLFREQTGMTLSRYLLWMRLLAGVAAVARGDSLTTAAHQAGFADLAHMSRSFRNTFGVVPSQLQKMTIAFKQTVQ
ncbi:helix-turn-helix transcriptional regulator [Noviherbaspirillum aerium]|uniref:helix-turn-helix transcriptional regulator n=1 Tax=Noviherbaspirillum aerium TaxID=2588497 RepID=UPI00178C40A5|nr:helix-turn-helix transcriptional regulator [Noviherbaspirillum aerium]